MDKRCEKRSRGRESACWPSSYSSFDKPKSVRRTCPSESVSTFSGFRSL